MEKFDVVHFSIKKISLLSKTEEERKHRREMYAIAINLLILSCIHDYKRPIGVDNKNSYLWEGCIRGLGVFLDSASQEKKIQSILFWIPHW